MRTQKEELQRQIVEQVKAYRGNFKAHCEPIISNIEKNLKILYPEISKEEAEDWANDFISMHGKTKEDKFARIEQYLSNF